MQGFLILLFVIAAIYVVYRFYFAGGTKAVENAGILGTGTKSNNIYHQLLVNTTAFQFGHDALILCYEKVYRSKQVVVNGQPQDYSVADQYALFGIDPGLSTFKANGLKDAVGLVKATLNDPKPIMLTHWVEARSGSINLGYSAYKDLKNKDYDLPAACMVAYAEVSELIKQKLQSGKYTHLIMACTGWNNHQDRSLKTYSNWLEQTSAAAVEDNQGENFRPFFVGFTWPSSWITPGLSFFNKANDADELGMTHVNCLLWKNIVPELKKAGISIPIISIGHSFGARVMSRAVHSRFMLQPVDAKTHINLAIDFQGAYALTRFCEKKGNNGGLYTIDIPVPLHVMTCSKFDHAIKQALWSVGYIGNTSSVASLKKRITTNDFGYCSLDDTGRLINFPEGKRKISVDAKSIINHISSLLAGAHSDVQDKEAGRFIWEMVKKIR